MMLEDTRLLEEFYFVHFVTFFLCTVYIDNNKYC